MRTQRFSALTRVSRRWSRSQSSSMQHSVMWSRFELLRRKLTHMSNNNDDDDRGASHADRSDEGSYTDLPKFRGFIGWVSNKGGGGTFSSVDVDIFHKDYLGECRKPDNYCGEYLTFLLPQWYIDSSLSSSSLSSIGQAQAAQQETSSLETIVPRPRLSPPSTAFATPRQMPLLSWYASTSTLNYLASLF
jgi:hypothetical protein